MKHSTRVKFTNFTQNKWYLSCYAVFHWSWLEQSCVENGFWGSRFCNCTSCIVAAFRIIFITTLRDLIASSSVKHELVIVFRVGRLQKSTDWNIMNDKQLHEFCICIMLKWHIGWWTNGAQHTRCLGSSVGKILTQLCLSSRQNLQCMYSQFCVCRFGWN